MPFLQDAPAPAPGDIDEPDRQRDGQENRNEEGAEQRAHGDGPGLLDLGNLLDDSHDRPKELADGQSDVDALVGIESDPVPEHRVEIHAEELETMLVELQREADEPRRQEDEETDDYGEFSVRKPTQHTHG